MLSYVLAVATDRDIHGVHGYSDRLSPVEYEKRYFARLESV